ncbi:MAG: ATP-binding cassette domain-containing protein [Eisenbergiella sp.]
MERRDGADERTEGKRDGGRVRAGRGIVPLGKRRTPPGFENQLGCGRKIALIGSNGAGKSTLMKMLVGLLKRRRGREAERQQHPEQSRNGCPQISVVYQNPEDMFIKDSIYHDVAYAMEVRGWKMRLKGRKSCCRFRLLEYRDRDGRLLSEVGAPGQPGHRGGAESGNFALDEPTADRIWPPGREYSSDDMKEITETVMIAPMICS